MTRKRWAQLALIAAAVIGVRFVVPAVSRATIRFEVAPTACASAVAVEVMSGGVTVKKLRVVPAPRGPAAVYETALHRGDYTVRVSLDCPDGSVIDGEPRPILISDESTIRLRPPGSCICGS